MSCIILLNKKEIYCITGWGRTLLWWRFSPLTAHSCSPRKVFCWIIVHAPPLQLRNLVLPAVLPLRSLIQFLIKAPLGFEGKVQAPWEIPIIQGPASRVREDLISLMNLNEPSCVLFSPVRGWNIRVVFPGHLLVSPLDIIKTNFLRDTQQLIETLPTLCPNESPFFHSCPGSEGWGAMEGGPFLGFGDWGLEFPLGEEMGTGLIWVFVDGGGGGGGIGE